VEEAEKIQERLLLLEYQTACEMYRFLFRMRFDLLKYFFTVVFAIASVAPVVVKYVQSTGVTDYMVLIFFGVIWILALLNLFTFCLLINWNTAVERHGKAMENIRKHVYSSDSVLIGLVPQSLPKDLTDGKLLHKLVSSAPVMEIVTVMFLVILQLVNGWIACWLLNHTCNALAFLWVPSLLLTGFSIFIVTRLFMVRYGNIGSG
jgi:hypothetical protein